jgi:N-acyl-D-aspartate/D-glutamate deacylase
VRADVVIKGGRILDGTGAPELVADLAIRSGRIAGFGEGFEAEEVVDASGKIVSPGFIDLHSHGDLVLAWPSEKRLALVEGRIAQGITTEIVGNCGLGAAPLFGAATDLLPRINGWMTPAPFPWSWKGTSDYLSHGKGKPHPAAYGSFPRILGRYVRRERLLTLPEAVRRMTSLPASILGLEDRGVLRGGAHADVVVFDPEAIEDRATLEEPRLKARGIDVVFVNGRRVYRGGALTGARPGVVLRAAGGSNG